MNVGPATGWDHPVRAGAADSRDWRCGLFINREAIYEIRPWHVIREGDIWFTKAKDSDTVYAILTKNPDWKKERQRKDFRAHRASRPRSRRKSRCSANLGACWNTTPKVIPETRWNQKDDGLHVSVMRAQRIYNNTRWPNPLVLKITRTPQAVNEVEIQADLAEVPQSTEPRSFTCVQNDNISIL